MSFGFGIYNPLDPSDGFSDGDGFVISYHGLGSNAAPSPAPVVVPAEALEAQAAVSGSGSGGVDSVVAETSGGLTINLLFDAAAMAAPPSFRAGIEQAAEILSATITNKITVNINIDYSGTGGGAAAGPDNGLYENYSTVRSDLIANAAPGDTSFNALPTGSTIDGRSQVAVWNAQLKLFGLISPNDTTTDDGSATFATDINPSLLVGVALHELTHAMGRVPYGPQPDIFDFYRFTSPGTQLFTDNIPAPPAYFSLDGGNTKLADFGVNSDPSDFLNSGVQGGNDPFNEYYSGSTLQSLTPVDLKLLDALGFNTIPQGLSVVANAAEALQGGAAVSLLSAAPSINDPGSATLSDATITIANASGNAVAGDELFVNGIENGSLGNGVTASWNATTHTLTLSGTASTAIYDTLLSEVTFQDTGTDTSSGSHPVRNVTWAINDGTNSYSATSQIAVDRAPVAANNTATDAAGATISTTVSSGVLSNTSDLDGDSLTVTAVSDTAHGAGTVGTSLAGVYGHLTLNANGSYSYVADDTSAINGAPTGTHLQDIFSYTVSDGNGGTANASLTVMLDRAPVVRAANITLSAGHTAVAASSLFSAADPDGNAITTYAFENTGPGHFVLNDTVVEPNNQEIDISAAQLSQLAYQATTGSLDTLEVRVNDGTLWSNWTSFTVTNPHVIQTDGTTALTEVGNDYFLNPTAGGTGPELKYDGSAVTTGAEWTPIGAVQVAGGDYDVAWHDASTGMYTVWSADANGNYLSNLIGAVPGNSASLESFETIFNQDLNGDGTIGLKTVVLKVDGTTALTEVGNDYFLNPTAGGTGPELKYDGSAVTTGAEWTPIGAVQVAGGDYDVAWHDASTGMYTVWSADANGNYLSNLIGAVPGNSASLESFEIIFNQDLNGDGTIGIPTVVLKVDGTTELTEVGNNYFLNPTGGGTGPELKYDGSAVTTGAEWTPIGAVQVAGGDYDVAWHDASTGMYTVWSADANGNYLSNLIGAVPGNSASLESFETIFNQDLNGDGYIGVPPATLPAGVQSAAAPASQITVDGHAPTLQAPSTFSGQVVGFAGDGTLAGSDQIDLHGLNSDTFHSSFDGASGTLSVSDGSTTASLQFLGDYAQDNFHFANGGNGGTLILAATAGVQGGADAASAVGSGAATLAAHDTFVFAPHFGQLTGSDFAPASDTVQFCKSVSANITALLAATHDDAGNPVISDAAHDTITFQHVTTAQLLAHQSDFHFV